MRILFWNTHKNENINDVLSQLIIENNASIIILAEYSAKIEELIAILALYGMKMRQYATCCERICLLGTLDCVELKLDASHYTIQIINGKDILCCVHLNSKLHTEHDGYREILIDRLIHDLQTIEEEIGTKNSIVVGDFNINPYEASCIDARYFHGISVCSEADRGSRIIAGNEYHMFYNPMWNFFGDFQKPYGTYYYNGGGTKNTYWNIFDQVIFRPTLKKRFLKDSLKILTETETKYLLDSNGHPDKNISDHLPIIFEIMEEVSHG